MNNEETLTASEEFNNNRYKMKIFRSVPMGCNLVKLNVFTGKIQAEGPGFYVNLPWTRSKIVSTESQPLSTPATSNIASDDITIYYDTDYHFKIVDPVKYSVLEQSLSSANEKTTVEKMMGRELDQLVANYVKKHSSNMFKSNSNLDIRDQIANDLAELGTKYGVDITKIILTNVQLPKSITSQAEKNRADEIKRPNDLKNAENAKKVAAADAQAKAIEIKTLADANKANLVNYTEAGISGEDIAKILSSNELVNGSNPNTFVFANTSNSNNLENNVAYMNVMREMLLNNSSQTGANNVSQQNYSRGSKEWWASLPDDQYLSPEDSKEAWMELKGEDLPDGNRVHISYLTPELLEKYKGRKR